ncbi:hypothetical protein ABT052_23160 [Streptomyces sp. NPDC002766]|uniref:hypothetical protein n=1 Tax=Streptomyces sp. NPDC002766 TaxID=3154429 RepID=UPI00331DCE19
MTDDDASHARAFAAELRSLFALAGEPTYSELDVPKATLSQWLTGKAVPRDEPGLAKLVRALAREADLAGEETVHAVAELERLRRLGLRERRRGQGRRGSASGRSEPAVRPDARPVAAHAHDPVALGVTHAVGDHGAPGGLPRYISRDHDGSLRAHVRAVAGGASHSFLVRGAPGSGKTRSSWEAVVAELGPGAKPGPLSGWRLWQPPLDHAEALAGLRQLPPRTVLWLDNADEYLLTPDRDTSEAFAAEVLRLRGDVERRPVLVLMTMRSAHVDALKADPAHRHAHRLLRVSREVPVGGRFSEDERARARQEAGRDPRFLRALEYEDGSRVTQYLAGALALHRQWTEADPVAAAVLMGAMTARRLGHHPELPEPLLVGMAAHWAPDTTRSALGRAFGYCVTDCQGLGGLLVRVDREPGRSEAVRYRLSNFLEREKIAVPARRHEVWRTLAQHADAESCAALAERAAGQGLFDVATRLYDRAAAAGEPVDHGQVIRVRARADRARPGMPGRDRETGTRPARSTRRAENIRLRERVRELERERGAAVAVRELRGRAEAGDAYARRHLAWLLEHNGRYEEALEEYFLVSLGGDACARAALGRIAERAGLRRQFATYMKAIAAVERRRD